MNRTVSHSVALFLFLVASIATAGELGPPPKKAAKAAMKWTVKNSPLAGAPGDIVKLELYGEVPAGYYTYSTRVYPAGGPVAAPPTFVFEPANVVAIEGAITYTEPHIKKTDEGDVEVFEKDVTFTIPLKIANTAAPGEQKLTMLVDSQVCNAKNCTPDMNAAVPFVLNVGGKAVTNEPVLKFTKTAVKWTVKNSPISGARGELLKLEVHGEIPAGFHTYPTRPQGVGSSPTAFEPTAGAPFKIEGAVVDPPTIKDHEFEVLEKEATFIIPIRLANESAPGTYPTKLTVDSQVCTTLKSETDRGQCIQSTGVEVAFVVNITDAALAKTNTGLNLNGIDLKSGLGGKGLDLGGLSTSKVAVKWTVKNTPLTGARGELVKLELHGEIPEGHYTYPGRDQGPGAAPTVVNPIAGAPFKVDGPLVDPPTKKKEYPGLTLDVLEHEAVFTVPIRIALDATPGAYPTKLSIDGQVCSSEKCIPATGVEVPFVLNITDAPPIAATPSDTKPAAPTSSSTGQGGVDDITKARQQGLWSFLKLSMFTGFLALLTPCVFPMIPITVSFFTKRKQATRAAAVRDAGVYAVGIICAFVVLGFLFTFLMGATGVRDFATNPWANIVVATVFMALAFSLFGAYEIQLPTSIMNSLNKKAGDGDGVLSVLLMGVVFALTSFTCTVPFIGAVLVTATQGDLLWPAVGMLGFATVFAAPFLVLAVIPALLKSLPKSGGWLNSVKVVMGFLEIAAAMKFASNVDIGFQWGILTRELFLAIWIALILMIVFYLLGKFQMTHDSPVERIGAARATLATAFLGLAVWMVAGLFGMKLGELDAFIPPRIYPGQKEPSFAFGGGGGTKSEHLTWIEDYDVAMAEAKKRNVPLFLDFTGDQCTNCRLMEENIFPRPEIQALLSQFVRAKLVTDRKSGPDRERSIRYVKMQEERFGTASLPFYVILSPDDKVLATFDGLTRDAAAYAAFLQKGTTGKSQTAWHEDIKSAMAQAKAENRPLFLNFNGCVGGRMMDEFMLKQPRIESLLQNFVLLKLVTGGGNRQRSDINTRFQEERFNSVSQPFYAVISPSDEVISTFEGVTRDANAYAAFLEKGLSESSNSVWLSDYDTALSEAKVKNRPLFVDFSTDICTSSRAMELYMLARPEITRLLDKFIRVRLHTDRKYGDERERSLRNQNMLRDRFFTTAQPFYAIISPDDRTIETFEGATHDAERYEAFLKRGTSESAAR